ncbi:MAG TPA: hypothetical protein VJJ23_06775 [Candidatus Nanoarchaeia archaeon]|nr:hypothetical protein [Candidatus Nanoarchaeia archaeon]
MANKEYVFGLIGYIFYWIGFILTVPFWVLAIVAVLSKVGGDGVSSEAERVLVILLLLLFFSIFVLATKGIYRLKDKQKTSSKFSISSGIIAILLVIIVFIIFAALSSLPESFEDGGYLLLTFSPLIIGGILSLISGFLVKNNS